jgi:hypothetical protein
MEPLIQSSSYAAVPSNPYSAPSQESMGRDSVQLGRDIFEAHGGVVFPFSDADLRQVRLTDEACRLACAACCTPCQLGMSMKDAGRSNSYALGVTSLRVIGDFTKGGAMAACSTCLAAAPNGAATAVAASASAPSCGAVMLGAGLALISVLSSIGVADAINSINMDLGGVPSRVRYTCYVVFVPVCTSFQLSRILELNKSQNAANGL